MLKRLLSAPQSFQAQIASEERDLRTSTAGRASTKQRFEWNIPFPVQLGLVFFNAAVGFLLLRTSDYLAVDGALRALEVYQRGEAFLHPNNHLLYPVDVYIWSKILGSLGLHAHGPFAFLAIAQSMNGVAAAGCLAILYGLCYKLTNRASIAAVITIGLGLSRAFLAHATNSSEPMVGLLWTFVSLALVLYGASSEKIWPRVLAGLFLALATATYQSMLLTGPALAFLLWQWPGNQGGGPRSRKRFASIMHFGAGVVFGGLFIFGSAYYWEGTRTVAGLVHRFLRVDPFFQAETGVRLLRFVTMLPGLTYALFPCLPRDCSGFRCLGEAVHHSWIPLTGLAVGATALLTIALLIFGRTLWPMMTKPSRVSLIACLICLIPTMALLATYMPTYDKLWLQPLACIYVISAVIFATAARLTGQPARRFRYLVPAGCAVVAVVGASNLGRFALSSPGSTPYLTDAQQLATLVQAEDLLVGDWNEPFLLYQAFWAERNNAFNVPTDAIHFRGKTVGRLRDLTAHIQQRGGKIFFIGLLDIPAEEWRSSFNGSSLPYSAFDAYRMCTHSIRPLLYHSRMITLRQLDACPAFALTGGDRLNAQR